jgi:hypothetical protein
MTPVMLVMPRVSASANSALAAASSMPTIAAGRRSVGW